jgi:Mg-chelatase subunit ChlD
MTNDARPTHVYFVLDRSGSMQSIAGDVIGGFNSFLAAQRADGPDARMTLIQFDSHDSHEVVADAVAISEIADLTPATFVPRGGTPLYDAMGHAIADAAIRCEMRHARVEIEEEILFLTFTDGEENQSVEYTREGIFDLITKREAMGWTFAYLGANQDAYAESGRIGYAAASAQNFAADAAGTAAAFSSLSRAVSRRRDAVRAGVQVDRSDFFGDDKTAEADLERRGRLAALRRRSSG